MSQLDKLLARLRNNPKSARFDDLVRLYRSVGWYEVGGEGSHCRFEPADESDYRIVVRPHGGRQFCAVADVLKTLRLVETERERQQAEADDGRTDEEA